MQELRREIQTLKKEKPRSVKLNSIVRIEEKIFYLDQEIFLIPLFVTEQFQNYVK